MAQEEKESSSYSGNLARTLTSNFRKEKIYCDATMVVEGQQFYAHRDILAAEQLILLQALCTARPQEKEIESFCSYS